MPIKMRHFQNYHFNILLLCFLGGCPEPEAKGSSDAQLNGPCLHGVYCEPDLECIEGVCIVPQEAPTNDAGTSNTQTTPEDEIDAGDANEDVFSVCSPLVGSWNIAIESDGEATCGQDPTTQPYVVSIDSQGELQALWNTTAGADEYEMTSEFLLVDGNCALKNDSIFIIHAPPMNNIPATDIQVDYHYTVIADGVSLDGSGTMHTSTTIVETGEAQQDCTQDILISGNIETE